MSLATHRGRGCNLDSHPGRLPQFGLRQRKAQQYGGIHVHALPANGEVKMRSGGAARGAAEADFFPSLDALSFFHLEFGEVQVKAEQSLAMIDHDAVALEVEEPREQHCA